MFKFYLLKEKIPQNIINVLLENIEPAGFLYSHNGWKIQKSDEREYDLKIYPDLWIPTGVNDASSVRKLLEAEDKTAADKLNKILFSDGEYLDDGTYLSYFSPQPEFFIHIKDGQIVFEGIPLSNDNHDKIKFSIFYRLLPDYLKDFNPDKAAKQAVGCIEKDTKKATELTDNILMYKEFDKMAEWLTNQLIEDITSTEVVTFSAPKLILHLFEMSGGKV